MSAKPMTNRRILRALEAVRDSMPVWDAEALAWCRRNKLIEIVQFKGMPADMLTVDGLNLLTDVEQYFAQTLRTFRQSGQLRRPATNDQKENDNTHEQGQHGSKGKARKGQKEQADYHLCKRRDCGQRDFPGEGVKRNDR